MVVSLQRNNSLKIEKDLLRKEIISAGLTKQFKTDLERNKD